MNSIRQKKICDFIESRQIVTIKELQNLYPDVSLMTIHRDLDALVQSGSVVKIRGGARAVRHTPDLRCGCRRTMQARRLWRPRPCR